MSKNNLLYSKVFSWLGLGLLITFAIGYSVSICFSSVMVSGLAFVSIIAELVIAFVMGLCLHKLSPMVCTILYIIYCALSGFNFSIIFLVYKMGSIIYVFLITSLIFLLFAVLGRVTKIDFRKLGIYLFFTIIAVIIGSIINIFIGSNALSFGLTIVSIIVFMLYILYDMKIIDDLETTYGTEKAAVYGAFQLYIDFINLFIDILRLIGKAKD